MKLKVFIYCFIAFYFPVCTLAQKGDSSKTNKPEIFSSGFIDVMNNGQVNASARFIKLFLGEPGKFPIPLSFYIGASNNTFQNQNISAAGQLTKSNDHFDKTPVFKPF